MIVADAFGYCCLCFDIIPIRMAWIRRMKWRTSFQVSRKKQVALTLIVEVLGYQFQVKNIDIDFSYHTCICFRRRRDLDTPQRERLCKHEAYIIYALVPFQCG